MNKLSRIGISVVIILLVLLFFVSLVFTNDVFASAVQPAPTYRLEITNLPEADYLFVPYIECPYTIDAADHKLYLRYLSGLDDESYEALKNDTHFVGYSSDCFFYTFICYEEYEKQLNINYVEFALKYLHNPGSNDKVGFCPQIIQYYQNTTEIQWNPGSDYYNRNSSYSYIKPYLYDITHDLFYSFNEFEYEYVDYKTKYTMDYSKDGMNFYNGKESEQIELGGNSPDSKENYSEPEIDIPSNIEKTFECIRIQDIIFLMGILLCALVMELAITFIFGYTKRSLITVSIVSLIGWIIFGAILLTFNNFLPVKGNVVVIAVLITLLLLIFIKPLIYRNKCAMVQGNSNSVYLIGFISNFICVGCCVGLVLFLASMRVI